MATCAKLARPCNLAISALQETCAQRGRPASAVRMVDDLSTTAEMRSTPARRIGNENSSKSDHQVVVKAKLHDINASRNFVGQGQGLIAASYEVSHEAHESGVSTATEKEQTVSLVGNILVSIEEVTGISEMEFTRSHERFPHQRHDVHKIVLHSEQEAAQHSTPENFQGLVETNGPRPHVRHVDAAPFAHFEEFFGMYPSMEHCAEVSRTSFSIDNHRVCGFGPSILERRISGLYSAANLQDTLELLMQPLACERLRSSAMSSNT